MSTIHRTTRLPTSFESLVREMPPRAIATEAEHEQAVEMIDRLMASGRLSKGQAVYLETLVQLVQAYEASHDSTGGGVGGVELLKHLVEAHAMSATDLAGVLGVHASMGSKILNGERALTVEHARTLGKHFKLRFHAFLDG